MGEFVVETSLDALAVGRSSTGPFIYHFENRSPTPQDVNYPIQKRWVNKLTDEIWILEAYSTIGGVLTAIWSKNGSGNLGLEFLTGNTGGPVGVDANHNINVIGDGTTIVDVGNPATNTITWSTGPTVATLYVENIGTAVPVLGVLNVLGGTGVTTAGAGNTITINAAGSVATTYQEDSGSAVPAANILKIVGGAGISTSGAGNTVTITNTGITPIGAFNAIKNQVFTTTGTYTPTANMVFASIQILGGGGAGGGCVITSNVQLSASSGGGAGEYAVGIFTAAAIGASKPVTIGAGGTAASGTTGGNGGTTSVGALITAFGGSGGRSGPASSNYSFAIAGAGGTGGAGGDYRTPGMVADTGWAFYVTGANNLGVGSNGANSQLGSGGINIGSGTGGVASGFGAGGSGTALGPSDGPSSGGNGTPGIVIVTEYIT